MSDTQYSFDDRNPLYHQRRRARGLLEQYDPGDSREALNRAAAMEPVNDGEPRPWPGSVPRWATLKLFRR